MSLNEKVIALRKILTKISVNEIGILNKYSLSEKSGLNILDTEEALAELISIGALEEKCNYRFLCKNCYEHTAICEEDLEEEIKRNEEMNEKENGVICNNCQSSIDIKNSEKYVYYNIIDRNLIDIEDKVEMVEKETQQKRKTGKKDINEIEIKEGDTIMYLDSCQNQNETCEYEIVENKGVVFYDESICAFDVTNRKEIEREELWLSEAKELKVI